MNKKIIKKFQGDLEVTSRPFNRTELSALKKLKKSGVLRRFSAIVRHRQLGFRANCMIVWQVSARQGNKLGKILASFPQVSHCYLRPGWPAFPFNLYAMVHGKSRLEIISFARRAARLMKRRKFLMLWSLREIKKSSPVF